MEVTPDVAEFMIRKRLEEHPEVSQVVSNPNFKKTLSEILAYEEINLSYLPLIERELLIVLSFYAPLYELPKNISETTGLPLEKCTGVVTLVRTLLLEPLEEELFAFQLLWKREEEEEWEKHVLSGKKNPDTEVTLPEQKDPSTQSVPPAPKDVREKLDLRPEGVLPNQTPNTNDRFGNERPLTREEVLRSITPKRTMASDIESVRKEKEGEHSPFGDSR